MHFTAAFTSCQCSAEPVTAGRRLLLLYSVQWGGPPQEVPALEDDSAVVAVQQVVRQWEQEIAEGKAQQRLVVMTGELR